MGDLRHSKPYRVFRRNVRRLQVFGRRKVFGVGPNKTGTTSLTVAMRELGFIVGNEAEAQKFVRPWSRGEFSGLIEYCRTAQFFQDQPFSLPFTFVVLDQAFPGSKFVLTVRNSAEEWYDSVIRYMTHQHGRGGRLPTRDDLARHTYVRPGFMLETALLIDVVTEDDLFNKEALTARYSQHIDNVQRYFRHRESQLLVLNVSKPRAYRDLCDFLGVPARRDDFPWANKTPARSP